jgi:hypothetical protein
LARPLSHLTGHARELLIDQAIAVVVLAVTAQLGRGLAGHAHTGAARVAARGEPAAVRVAETRDAARGSRALVAALERATVRVERAFVHADHRRRHTGCRQVGVGRSHQRAVQLGLSPDAHQGLTHDVTARARLEHRPVGDHRARASIEPPAADRGRALANAHDDHLPRAAVDLSRIGIGFVRQSAGVRARADRERTWHVAHLLGQRGAQRHEGSRAAAAVGDRDRVLELVAGAQRWTVEVAHALARTGEIGRSGGRGEDEPRQEEAIRGRRRQHLRRGLPGRESVADIDDVQIDAAQTARIAGEARLIAEHAERRARDGAARAVEEVVRAVQRRALPQRRTRAKAQLITVDAAVAVERDDAELAVDADHRHLKPGERGADRFVDVDDPKAVIEPEVPDGLRFEGIDDDQPPAGEQARIGQPHRVGDIDAAQAIGPGAELAHEAGDVGSRLIVGIAVGAGAARLIRRHAERDVAAAEPRHAGVARSHLRRPVQLRPRHFGPVWQLQHGDARCLVWADGAARDRRRAVFADRPEHVRTAVVRVGTARAHDARKRLFGQRTVLSERVADQNEIAPLLHGEARRLLCSTRRRPGRDRQHEQPDERCSMRHVHSSP